VVKGKRKGHRRAGSNADSIPISVSLTNSTSDLTQEPPQGSFIWLFGAPEIPVSTENSESMQRSSDLYLELLSWLEGRFRSRAELETRGHCPDLDFACPGEQALSRSLSLAPLYADLRRRHPPYAVRRFSPAHASDFGSVSPEIRASPTRLDQSMIFVIDITKCRHIPVALRIAPNVVWVSRDRHRKSGPNLIQPNGGPSARL